MSNNVEQYTEYIAQIGVKFVQKWYNKRVARQEATEKKTIEGDNPQTKRRCLICQ